MEYLALPFVLRNGYLGRAEIFDSIVHSIGLILSTRLNMLPFDPDFGCDIWDKEFSDVQTINKSDMRAGLRNAISRYEKRLENVAVSFMASSDNKPHTIGMIARVTGTYFDGKSKKRFEASYIVG
ncbi:MAG TPA: hypothetical protein ENL22_07045 [candidate division Zixibacteria bacterium]|nr:hypothetical protein [candidate division Zixibacteria bacterium]